MTVEQPTIPGLHIFQPRIFNDDRGYFYESFNQQRFEETVGHSVNFVQDNQSLSMKDTLRGLHLQRPPYAQGKLVRVIQGAALDVAVDVRKGSPTYGQYHAVELTGENHLQFWIPPGFAHGFLTLKDHTIFTYKVTNYYNKESEDGVMWNDSDINVNWGIEHPLLSAKDQEVGSLKDFDSPFEFGL